MAQSRFEVALQEGVGQPEHVQQRRVAEGIRRDCRALGNLRVRDLTALERLAGDGVAQVTDAEVAVDDLLHVEGSCVVGCERKQLAEVGPTDLLRQ